MEELTIRHSGNVLVAAPKGEITSDDIPELGERLRRELEDFPGRRVALDLSEVPFVDSSAIGFLVSFNNRTANAGKTMHLVAISPQVEKTLNMVRLMPIFNLARRLEELAGD